MSDTYFTEEQLKSLPVDTLVTITMTLQNNVIDLKRSVDQLTEQIRIMNQRMYGRKTKKESLLYKQEQLDLAFNETERRRTGRKIRKKWMEEIAISDSNQA